MKRTIALILLISLNFTAHSFADVINTEEESECNLKEEAAAEKLESECLLKEPKSKKTWKSVEEAEKSIALALKQQNSSSLVDYIGCDSSDSSSLHTHCVADKRPLNADDLNTLLKKSKGRTPLKTARWIRYGVGNRVHVWCTKDYGFKAAKNYCGDDEALQPMIEIIKSTSGYYIFGVPLSGETK